jgi:hypothetical protein
MPHDKAASPFAESAGSESFTFAAGGLRHTCMFSRFADGRVGEIFLSNHNANRAADTAARHSASCHRPRQHER